jgi:hypothetical protein
MVHGYPCLLAIVEEETDIAVASTQEKDNDHLIKVSMNLPISNEHVDRAMSAFLKCHISPLAWKIWLEDLEKVIEDRRQVGRYMWWSLALSTSLGVLCVVLILTVSGVPESVKGASVFAIPILWIVTLSLRQDYWERHWKRITENLQSICRQESLKYDHLSFQFEERTFCTRMCDKRETRWNIHILVFPPAAISATSLDFVEQEISMAIAPHPFRLSPAEPMQQFDGTKTD